MKHVCAVDREVYQAVVKEMERQEFRLQMIASENYASRAVLETMANVMSNKYAEGYPGKRYYGGCENVDVVEELARRRAMELFRADFANVQPHSGSQANMAVYMSVCEPGDVVLGMDLSHGGHLTHGSPVNFSGRLYKVVHYGVKEDTELIDYDMVRDLAKKHRPKLIVTGASAYPRDIDFKTFRDIADEVGAYLMADIAHPAGLVVAGLHSDPVPHAHFVTATTHKTLRGPRGGLILGKADFEKKVNTRVFPGTQDGPMMHVIAAKAVAFKEALSEEFKRYQKQVIENARTLAEELTARGYRVVSGGTDTHLLLVDLRNRNITGKEAEAWLDAAWITVNKNTIPFDPQPPAVASGIRIGTPGVTSRGMGVQEMKEIAEMIDKVLSSAGSEDVVNKVRVRVRELCESFPIYRDWLEEVKAAGG